MNMDLKFHQVRALATRGAVDPGPDEPLGRVVLVGTEPAGRWRDGETRYGHDLCSLFPVWDRGERAWLLRTPITGRARWLIWSWPSDILAVRVRLLRSLPPGRSGGLFYARGGTWLTAPGCAGRVRKSRIGPAGTRTRSQTFSKRRPHPAGPIVKCRQSPQQDSNM